MQVILRFAAWAVPVAQSPRQIRYTWNCGTRGKLRTSNDRTPVQARSSRRFAPSSRHPAQRRFNILTWPRFFRHLERSQYPNTPTQT